MHEDYLKPLGMYYVKLAQKWCGLELMQHTGLMSRDSTVIWF